MLKNWVVLLAGAAAGCSASPLFPDGEDPPDPGECTPASAREVCDRGVDSNACAWADLYERRVDAVSLAAETGAATTDLDAAMQALVPELAGKTFSDEAPAVPPAPVFPFLNYAPHQVEFPIDWTADPETNNSWRLYFQDLSWIYRLCEGDQTELEQGLYVLHDWASNVLYAEPALEWTWDDHALGVRLARVASCLERYAASRDVLNRQIVHSAVSIITTHLRALGVEACYVPLNNHGVMQDLAVLENVRRYPSLREGRALWDLALRRIDAQIAATVTSDGIQVENSPDYHVLYLRLVNDAIDAVQRWNEPPTTAMVAARDAMIDALIHQLQPDLSLPQFGDTENGSRQSLITQLLAIARQQGGSGPSYDQLEWLITDGAAGTEPTALDRVFEVGGYAAFHTAWAPNDPFAISAHFACKRLTTVHYHHDDTSFEIFGFGRELIVDTGKFSYDDNDPLVIHQYKTSAHNVLTVDHNEFRETGMPQIIGHGSEPGLSWVQGAHSNYEHLGIRSQSRTFAHHKPDTFVVVDHVSADGFHKYVQHFHLHPSLSSVTRRADGVVIATTPDGNGPTVVLAPERQLSKFLMLRGTQDDELTQGWHFAGWEIAEPATDVIFRYDRDGGDHDFPVVITVSPPGQQPTLPGSVEYAEAARMMNVSWTVDGESRRVAIPSPPAERVGTSARRPAARVVPRAEWECAPAEIDHL